MVSCILGGLLNLLSTVNLLTSLLFYLSYLINFNVRAIAWASTFVALWVDLTVVPTTTAVSSYGLV